MSTSAVLSQPHAPSRGRLIAYWLVTLFICFELIYGGLWDLNVLNKNYVYGVLEHLGYPLYLAALLGVCKFAAAIVFLSPGLLLLKEWAYAGIVILFSAAFLSHLIVGDGLWTFVWSLLFSLLTVLSWALRPGNRRLVGYSSNALAQE
jgi:cbb3-type cytochrome oxidase subunit 3